MRRGARTRDEAGALSLDDMTPDHRGLGEFWNGGAHVGEREFGKRLIGVVHQVGPAGRHERDHNLLLRFPHHQPVKRVADQQEQPGCGGVRGEPEVYGESGRIGEFAQLMERGVVRHDLFREEGRQPARRHGGQVPVGCDSAAVGKP